MSPNPAVAPYVPTYASRQPYLTRAEFMAAPTGVDVSQLVQGGTTSANGSALDSVLLRASSSADTIVNQVLAATVDLQAGVYRVRADGTIRVPVDFTPLVAVTDVKIGWRPGALSTLADLSGLWLQRKTVQIPVWTSQVSALADGRAGGGRAYVQVSYVNGWANTVLAADVAADASSVTVADATGIFPGLQLRVCDDGQGTSETVIVDESYTIGSSTVPLADTLTSVHTAGTALSALPAAVKQAVILLAADIIKTRGAEALTVAAVSGGPAGIETELPGSSEEYTDAVRLLKSLRRVW